MTQFSVQWVNGCGLRNGNWSRCGNGGGFRLGSRVGRISGDWRVQTLHGHRDWDVPLHVHGIRDTAFNVNGIWDGDALDHCADDRYVLDDFDGLLNFHGADDGNLFDDLNIPDDGDLFDDFNGLNNLDGFFDDSGFGGSVKSRSAFQRQLLVEEEGIGTGSGQEHSKEYLRGRWLLISKL